LKCSSSPFFSRYFKNFLWRQFLALMEIVMSTSAETHCFWGSQKRFHRLFNAILGVLVSCEPAMFGLFTRFVRLSKIFQPDDYFRVDFSAG
jgi:hypothetical protein